jgi:hypothetical protein
MRPKESTIKPGNDINERIYKALLEKQGDDSLYEICKRTGLFPGTFRRTLEAPNAWNQAKTLYEISEYLNRTFEYLLLGKKTTVDEVITLDKEVRYWKEKATKFENLYNECHSTVKRIKETLVG